MSIQTQAKAPADLAAQVAALQTRLAQARRDRARADHEVDAARAAADDARAALHTEFGVTTAAEARELLAQLEADVATALTDLTTQLAAMETR